MMNNYCLLPTLAACLLLSACAETPNFEVPHSIDLAWTNCAGTKAMDTKGESDKNKTTWLVLEHTPAGLAVTLLDAELNCAIQTDGLTLNVEMAEGNVINYTINLDPLANCNCLIERVSSTVDGLQEGKEYVLNYDISYWLPLKPIKFRYHSGLKMYVDVWKNIDESRIIHGSE